LSLDREVIDMALNRFMCFGVLSAIETSTVSHPTDNLGAKLEAHKTL